MKRITLTFPWPMTAEETRDILSFIFQIALVSYLVLYLFDTLKTGFVTNYFSLAPYFWTAVISGVLSGTWPVLIPEARKNRTTLRWTDYFWLGVLTLGTMVAVYTKTRSLGELSMVVVLLSGLAVLGVGLLIYIDHDERAGE